MSDVWGKLWEKANSNTATIEVTEFPGEVILHWSDGSKALLYWYDNEWRFSESLYKYPGDIAARDSF